MFQTKVAEKINIVCLSYYYYYYYCCCY